MKKIKVKMKKKSKKLSQSIKIMQNYAIWVQTVFSLILK